MSKRKTQIYTPEYRSEAIKLVLEQGLSVSEAATRLSMNHGTLAYWVTQARKGVKSASSVAGAQSSANWQRRIGNYAKNWRKPGWSATS